MVRNSLTGFTLVELLIAISIIAVISTIGFTTYQGTQAKARDNVRKSDLTQLATALEAYYQKNKSYVRTNSQQCNSTNSNKLYKEIDDYMTNNQVPNDPQGSRYCYFSKNNGDSFRLFAKLENCHDPQAIPDTCSSAYNFSITSDDLLIAAAPTGGGTPPPPPPPGPPPPPPPPPAPPASTAFKRVFVTSTVYPGNLGGLSGADSICQTRANEGSLAGTWKAWLSDSSNSPSTRFSATVRSITTPVTFKLVDGTIISNGWTNLTDGAIDNPINRTETNVQVTTPSPFVWTGTYSDGGQAPSSIGGPAHCSNWTVTSGGFPNGSGWAAWPTRIDFAWTTSSAVGCDASYRLYCFEQ